MAKEKVEAFRSDFFLPVFYLNNPDKDPPGDRMLRHVDATMKLMTAITGNRNYIDAGQELAGDGKEDAVSMSDMFTRAEARGRAAEREAIREEMERKDREIAELRRQLEKSKEKD